jgi:MarR family transcriptional regulator, organic hydroperoxide resistance regulator
MSRLLGWFFRNGPRRCGKWAHDRQKGPLWCFHHFGLHGHANINFVDMSDLKSLYNQCLYHSTVSLGRTLTRMADEQFKPMGITPTMGFILMTAKAAPGIIINDLAMVHQLDASPISRTIDKLAAQGYVVREGQGREMRVFNTQKGLRKEVEAQGAWSRLQLAYRSILTEGRSRHLAEQVIEADIQLRAAIPTKRRTKVNPAS